MIWIESSMNSFIFIACFLATTAAAGFTKWDNPSRIAESQLNPDVRISGGVDIDISEVPYLVALETKGNKAYQYCAGALITRKHVLTAAQCLTKPADKIRIRAGSKRRNKGGITYEIESHVKHPKFDPNTFDFDVGIVNLETNVTLGETVKLIKISDARIEDGTKLTIAGWGMTEEDGELSPILQKAETPLLNREKCSDLLKMFLLSITERMICTLGNGTDTCVGDGGGPLVSNGGVTGIISWGIGCGRPFFPSIHINVTDPDVRSFIRAQTNV